MSDKKCCGTCRNGWDRENGKISCEAPVSDEALSKMHLGKNPTWAWRKYGPFAMVAIMSGKAPNSTGTDCENMDPGDGTLCAAWEEK